MSGIKRFALMVDEALGLTTVYWMRSGDRMCLHVRREGVQAEEARAIASDIAADMGCADARSGAFMHVDGNGEMEGVGVAEMPWSPRVESELSRRGFAEVR